jgi:hypothetical protein
MGRRALFLDISIFSVSEQQHPSSPLISKLAQPPLLMMARNVDHSKHPWSEGPSHGDLKLPSHRMRMATGLDRALSLNR